MSVSNYVVVGGSKGIGAQLVRRLASAADAVTVISRTASEVTTSQNVKHIEADITQDEISPDDLPSVISGLAYCPGSISLGPIRRVDAPSMLADYELNVVGAVKCLQAALNAMKAAEASSMVLFSTVAVGQGLPMHASVAAAKGAVEGLTRALAAELAPKIRVNCIAPSLTDTPLAEKLLANEQKRAAMADRHPLKRIGTPDDVASLAEFLLTKDSSWISGQVIGVDGGMSSLRV